MDNESGQSLIEIVVALTVGILVVVALVFATIFSLRNASFAKNSAQATKLAQEGIERVRTGRDRNARINGLGLPSSADCPSVTSWNDVTGSIWSCKIYLTCGSGGNCYFKFHTTSPSDLDYLTTTPNFPAISEAIPPAFQRVIILSDDSVNSGNQKTVTAIVRWIDATGPHDSRLTTILRKL